MSHKTEEVKGSQSLTDADLVYTAMHPTRLEILTRVEAKPSYASKLEEQTKIDRKILSFHLSVLERAGLVTSEFGLKNDPEERPVAVRYYKLTEKGEQVLKRVRYALR